MLFQFSVMWICVGFDLDMLIDWRNPTFIELYGWQAQCDRGYPGGESEAGARSRLREFFVKYNQYPILFNVDKYHDQQPCCANRNKNFFLA